MKQSPNLRRLTCCTLALAICGWAESATAQPPASYFSPAGQCANAIAAEIANAKTSIDIAAYELTLDPLAQALLAADARGVAIRVIVNPTQETINTPYPKHLQGHGIQLRTDRKEKLFHNKYAIFDGVAVETGSYNWTANAETANAENVVILHDATTAAAFAADFATHWNHSDAYRVRTPKKKTPRGPLPKPTPTPPTPTKKGT
jgi:phosphatidylserine/phosphatidylglycerophosphate/cardiolipin synthase-like enzyme